LSVILGIAFVVTIVTAAALLVVRKLNGGNKLAIVLGRLFASLFLTIVGTLGVVYD
jgi:hypothetical protein